MVEALKARYRVYRWFFGFRVWMARLGTRAQWIFIIGLLIFMRMTSAAGRAVPTLKLPAQIIVGIYLGFVFFSWAGEPLSNFLLRLNRFGRQALNRQETWIANIVGGCLLLAIASALVGCAGTTLRYPGFAGCAVFVCLILPASAAVTRQSGWPRRTMAGMAVMIAGLSSLALALSLLSIGMGEPDGGQLLATLAALVAVLGAAGCSWLGLVLPKGD
jgi:hypothetical protein